MSLPHEKTEGHVDNLRDDVLRLCEDVLNAKTNTVRGSRVWDPALDVARACGSPLRTSIAADHLDQVAKWIGFYLRGRDLEAERIQLFWTAQSMSRKRKHAGENQRGAIIDLRSEATRGRKTNEREIERALPQQPSSLGLGPSVAQTLLLHWPTDEQRAVLWTAVISRDLRLQEQPDEQSEYAGARRDFKPVKDILESLQKCRQISERQLAYVRKHYYRVGVDVVLKRTKSGFNYGSGSLGIWDTEARQSGALALVTVGFVSFAVYWAIVAGRSGRALGTLKSTQK